MSYGAFALAWGLGHAVVLGYAFRNTAAKLESLTTLANALYRALQIGVVLLAAGTILGGVWANYSWGRFWGWDPKETWALIALLGYLVVLHGRFIGWYGPFGIAMGAVLAFMGVVMAWYGVNFVLAAGLHSYGFGGGGYPYVASFVLADLALVGVAAYCYKRKQLSKK
jgi:ABC-type transport system involved in cytochrome c biogenesis permease subunit